MDLLNDSKTRELHRRLCNLRDQDASLEDIGMANRQFKIHRKSLKRKALEKWKEDWLDSRYQKTIQSGGTASHDKLTDIYHARACTFGRNDCVGMWMTYASVTAGREIGEIIN